MTDGKILVVDPGYLFISRGLSIYKVERVTQTVQHFITLPCSLTQSFLSKVHILSRLLRLQVHHMIGDGEGGFYIIYGKRVLRVNNEGKVLGYPMNLIGSRPLCVVQYNGTLLYGEYRSNSERSSIGLYSYDGWSSKKILAIPGVRHIHGVFYDKFHDSLYVTTGDYGNEAGIWQLELHSEKLELLTGGSQQERAVQLVFSERYIYYGTDTPTESNFIYRIDKESKERERLGAVNSSIFYGVRIAGEIYFSTVAEPSECNTTKNIDLVHVTDSSIEILQRYKKDKLPMKYFQYGQLVFPYYVDGDQESELWFYKQGVTGSGVSESLSLS